MLTARLHDQIEEWRKRLLDLSKRNRLINCKIGARAAIEIVHPEPEDVWQRIISGNGTMSFAWKRDLLDEKDEDVASQLSLFSAEGEASKREIGEAFGETADKSIPSGSKRSEMDECLASPYLRAEHLLTQMADKTLGTRLNRLSLNAKTAIAEQGINVLYLAFGLLRWYESPSSDVPLISPLLLVPIELDRAGPDAPWKINLCEEEISPNHCLRQLLLSNFRIELPDVPESGLEDSGDRTAFLQSVSDLVRTPDTHSRWEVLDRVVLGTFNFQKLAMWQDLGANRDRIAVHDLCRAIAGDDTAPVSAGADLPGPADFDNRIHPKDIHTILDADSSQVEAILAAKAGMNVVLDGPPGTGKSQTIANIIAESLAVGKSVLFVSEKAAALEVVKRRLDASKLGDFCLECHSHKANKKQVIVELGRCLSLPSEEYHDQSEELARLHSVRHRLNSYVRALHRACGTLNISPYAAHGRLSRLKVARASRCPINNVLDIDAATLRNITEALGSLVTCRSVIENYDKHPWRGCSIASFSLTLQDDIAHDFPYLSREIARCAKPLATLCQHGFATAQSSMSEIETAVNEAKRLLQFPQLPAQWFVYSPREVVSRLFELQSIVARRQELWQELLAFRQEIVATDFRTLLTGVCESGGLWQSQLRATPPGTVKAQREWLLALADELAEVRQLVGEAVAAVEDFSRALRVRIDKDSCLGLISKLTALGSVVSQAGILKSSWFDDTKRVELQQVANKCQMQRDEATRLRTSLSKRMKTVAFESEGDALAAAASAFEPVRTRIWLWIIGEWRRFLDKSAPLYLQPPSGDATRLLGDILRDLLHTRTPGASTKSFGGVLGDMSQLRVYHALVQAVRSEEIAHAADVICDEHGHPRWQDFASGIQAISRLRAIMKIPDRLKQVLTTEGMIDRNNLASATTNLESRLKRLEGHVTSLGQRLSLTGIEAGKTTWADVSPSAFSEWLRNMESAVRQRMTQLDSVVSTFQEDRDVAFSDLPRSVARLEELHNLQLRQMALRSTLDGVLDRTVQIDLTSLTPFIELAHHVVRFLDTYGDLPHRNLLDVVTQIEARESITTACTALSATLDEAMQPAWKTIWKCFPRDQLLPVGASLTRIPLARLGNWLEHQAQAIDQLPDWIRFREIEEELRKANVLSVLHEVLKAEINIEEATASYLSRFYRVWLDAAYTADATLRDFRVDQHEELIATFRSLDRSAIDGVYKRIRTRLLADPDRPHTGMLSAPPSSEVGILLREVGKQKRHLPLRQLFRRIPMLILRLKPCLMMSPLAVSTYLTSQDMAFDLVIFDEASQVRPFDAIGAVYRGSQVIVAGDQKQLPPTNFFDRLVSDDDADISDDDDEDTSGCLSDFESVLDVFCSMGMPQKTLRWHYRSRREPLIAFSNRHYYGNRLATFPSVLDADGTTAVQFHFVSEGRWRSGTGGGHNPGEAHETALLVFTLLEQYPDQSLGVITFNQRQQFAVLDELTRLRSERPEMEQFFDEERPEPFFVKNLENVQGDERDRIIISVGYGPDDQGKFAMRFGPLNVQGGERRLNVAVTRAKEQVILVTSIHASDIDLNRVQSVGARMLRAYLDYAERGTAALGGEVSEDQSREADSPFEMAVEEALRSRGVDVRRQVGCGGFRIDLALVHPSQKGRYVLGIECDGATYHSSATARDRDRLRQEIVEKLGWTICRVWSTDWVRNPEAQIRRILEAFEKAMSTQPSDAERIPEQSSIRQEKPILRLRDGDGDDSGPAYSFSSIDEVPRDVLRDVILGVLRRYGQTTNEELIKAVARELGFQRVGNRIAARIGKRIKDLIAANVVRQADGDRLCAS